MDSYEATRAVFSRLQSIDPDNASKIMGLILLQDEGEKEMIRLAFGPENQLLAVINRAKAELGLVSNCSSSQSVVTTATSTTIATPHSSSASPFSSLSNPIPISRPTPLSLPLSSPRLPNAGLFNPPSPSSPSVWSVSPGSNHHGHGQTHLFSPPSGNPSMSYAAVVNGNSNGTNSGRPFTCSSPLGFGGVSSRDNFVDDYHLRDQNFNFVNDPLALQSPSSKDIDFFDQSSLDFVASPGGRSDSVLYPYLENTNGVENHAHFHRRSCSVNDVCFGGIDDSSPGAAFKSCLYYNRGFCKNGSSCKFVHGGGFGGDSCDGGIGSPYKFDGFDQCQQELIRSNIALQQRLAAAQLMGGMNSPYNKLNFLQSESQRSGSAAMLMGDEFHKFNRCRSPRNEFSGFGSDDPGSSRQIYLTFPADSTFREEDVSNYFSIYGPVQDVRIPYQQKRMFGFVTFHYPETVKRILAKGNPHFVCDSRVLVKPYKEKGKLPDKKQQHQQLERGEFSACTSPSGLDRREPFEIQIGPRMFYNTQEMLYRKKLEEQADLQQALELQGRRMMNLQLLELKSQQLQQNMSIGSPLSSPHLSHAALSQTAVPQSNGFTRDAFGEGKERPITEKDVKGEANAVIERNGSSDGANDCFKKEEYDLAESLEHILPDNLFASPTKSAGENRSVFSSSAVLGESVDVANATSATSSSAANVDSLVTATSASGGPSMAAGPPKSCFMEMPRFASGNGAVGM